MLTQYPKGLVAVVSDSFDIIKACTDYWGGELIDLIKNREGVLVVRPDSGDPATIVVEVLEALGSKFPVRLLHLIVWGFPSPFCCMQIS